MPKIQPPFVQYDSGYSLMGHIPGTQASVSYGPHPSPAVSPFCTVGLNQTSRDASYEHWQSAAMMYAHSYNQLRHSAFQVLFNNEAFPIAKRLQVLFSKTPQENGIIFVSNIFVWRPPAPAKGIPLSFPYQYLKFGLS